MGRAVDNLWVVGLFVFWGSLFVLSALSPAVSAEAPEPVCGQYLRWMESNASETARMDAYEADWKHTFHNSDAALMAWEGFGAKWRVNYTKYLLCKEGMVPR